MWKSLKKAENDFSRLLLSSPTAGQAVRGVVLSYQYIEIVVSVDRELPLEFFSFP